MQSNNKAADDTSLVSSPINARTKHYLNPHDNNAKHSAQTNMSQNPTYRHQHICHFGSYAFGYKQLFFFYFLYLTAFSFYLFPCVDSFYYWEWSKHLQLSYFDGAPLIALAIRFITFLFGDTIFALNILGVLFVYLSGFLVYKITALVVKAHNDAYIAKQTPLVASALWLLYPFVVTRYVVINVTYDGLECIFFLCVIYVTLQYLQTGRRRHIYLIGMFSGLLLLSKYTGIILLSSLLLFFLINKKRRQIFKHVDIYLSMLLCAAIFSPVIIWNIQHNFISFHYQLTFHLWRGAPFSIQHEANNFGLKGVRFFIIGSFLGTLHILFILLGYIFLFRRKTINLDLPANSPIYLLSFVISFYFFFWLIVSIFAHVSMSYMLTTCSLLVIIVSYYLVRANLTHLLKGLYCVFFIISIAIMVHASTAKHIHSQTCYKTNYFNPQGDTCYNAFIQTGIIQYTAHLRPTT